MLDAPRQPPTQQNGATGASPPVGGGPSVDTMWSMTASTLSGIVKRSWMKQLKDRAPQRTSKGGLRSPALKTGTPMSCHGLRASKGPTFHGWNLWGTSSKTLSLMKFE